MRKHTLLFLLLMMAPVLLVACSSGQPEKASAPAASTAAQRAADAQQTAQVHQVTIQGFKFQPQELTVSSGETVVFTNKDTMPHNAVAANKFDSGKIFGGTSGKIVAKEKGTFDYICTYHPNMKGRLIVR